MYDNSSLSLYQTCPMKYYLKYVRGLEKIEKDIRFADIEFGSAVHLFLDKLYTKKMNDSKEKIDLEALFSDYPTFPGEEVKNKEGVLHMCRKYYEHWKKVDNKFKVLDVEYAIQFDLGGYPFVVKVDTVIEIDGQIYGLEHKTTGNLGYWYFNRYFINSQISAQMHAIKQKYGQCSGILLNAMEIKFAKKPAILEVDDPNVNGYATSEVKYSSYHKYKRNMAYCSGHVCKFERELITRNRSEMEDWKINAVRLIEKIEADKAVNIFTKSDSGSACSMFKGCTMKELCKSSIGMNLDEEIMEVLYQEKEDSMDYLELEKANERKKGEETTQTS